MKKKIMFMIIIAQMMILHTCGIAYAEDYEKTIDYRYRFRARYNSDNWYSGFTEWDTNNDTTFTENQTYILNMESSYTVNQVTVVMVSDSDSGDFTITGTTTAGYPTPSIFETDVDYIYKYPTDTVDTDYTLSYTLSVDSDMAAKWDYINVSVMGINRMTNAYNNLKTTTFKANPVDPQISYGETVTYTGDDGYNYSGFVIRIEAHSANNDIVMDGVSAYKLWNLTNSLDTVTPEVNYGEQLDNINGTLGSIYSSITGGFTTVTNAISNIGSGILDGIEHLFVYDDWQEDLESITNRVSIPYIQELTAAFADITSIFDTYYPDDEIEIKLKNPMYTQHGGGEYMVNTTYSLETPLSVGIGGYTIKQLFHIISGLFVLAYFVKIVTKLMSVIGIRFDEFILPWIREVIHR